MNNILYMFWTGDNPLTENRKDTINFVQKTCGIELKVLDKNSIFDYELQNNKFHKSYKSLSYTHRADYLRCYFMHFYGGCYSDIKKTNFNWSEYINTLQNRPDKDILGYSEEKPEDIGVEPSEPLAQVMRSNYSLFVGNCAYICKKKSVITQNWFDILNKKLDEKYYFLEKNSSQHPQDFYGRNINGKFSTYPFRWTEICGDIFHKVCYLNNDRVLHGLPKPICINYR